MPIDCFDNCPNKDCDKNGHDVEKDLSCYQIDVAYEKYKDISCPVCGFYCLGKGGIGCIDKPSMCGLADSKRTADARIGNDKKLKELLIAKRDELEKDLAENDYSHIFSVKYSKVRQIESIDIILEQL